MLVLPFFLLLVKPIRALRGGSQTSTPYLYAGDAYPVIEYMASRGDAEPDFLYGTDQGFRLVEFYAKSEAASVATRDRFIRTANVVTDLAEAHNVTVETYAVSCAAAPALCEVQGMERFPVFLLYKPSSVQGILLEKLNAQSILDKMGIPQSKESAAAIAQLAFLEESFTGGEIHPLRTLDDLQSDIHLAFDTAMRHFIYNDSVPGSLSTEKRTALKSWLLLIHKTIPPAWPIHSTVKDLINSFVYVVKSKAYLLAILDGSSHKPTSSDYSRACRGGSAHTTDVECGTWEMIHAVTVGVVEYNKMVLDARDVIATESAATIIRNYINHFGMGNDADAATTTTATATATARTMRQYFLAQLDICHERQCLEPKNGDTAPGVADWIQLPLWMSETHTYVNLKLQQDRARATGTQHTLEQHMSTVWPPRSYCPACWNSSGQWNKAVVYQYMQLEYTQIQDLTDDMRQELFGTPLPQPFLLGAGISVELQQSTVFFFATCILLARFFMIGGRTLTTPKVD